MGEAASLRHGQGVQGVQRFLPRADERLARRAAAGDEAAFAAIFDRYHQELYRYCYSILRDPDDAQDALQSTMASALRSLPGDRREIALRPWLFRVAHNHAISIVRSRRPAGGERDPAALPDPRADGHPEARLRLAQLLRDLETLPERQRGALTMRELSGLSYEEIGAALAISSQAARQAVYEARVGLQGLEEGRAMDCDSVRATLSAGDRRRLRARRVRAHLKACSGCRDFHDAISKRSAELAELSPPLPALAAAALLQGLIGGGAGTGAGAGVGLGTGGAIAAGASKGAGASMALKGATTIVAATALGVGAADYSGLADVPLIGGSDERAGEVRELGSSGATPMAHPDSAVGARAPDAAGTAAADGRGAPGRRSQAERDRARGGAPEHAAVSGEREPGPPAHAQATEGALGPPPHAQAEGPPVQAQGPAQGLARGGSRPDSAPAPVAATPGVPAEQAAPRAQGAAASDGSLAAAHSQRDRALDE